MGRPRKVKEFPAIPKTVKWYDGREKEEIEATLQQLAQHMPEEYRGVTSKGILWAVRQLKLCFERVNKEDMQTAQYYYATEYLPPHTLELTDDELVLLAQPIVRRTAIKRIPITPDEE